MAIKTFTTGEVLTAANTNTYLANAGLDYIKSQTIGTGVGSVVVSDVFSATWDNYKIVMSGGTMSNDVGINLTLSSNSTGYYTAFIYGTYNANTVNGEGTNNVATWANAGGGYTGAAALDVTLYAPFLAIATNIEARCRFAFKWGQMQGLNTNSTSSTGFTIAPTIGTMTGGTITVYGYRKA